MPLLNQMKTADLLRRILRGDLTRLTPYPFTARKPEPAPCHDAGLPRSTPEREGVPSGYLAGKRIPASSRPYCTAPPCCATGSSSPA